MPRYYRNKKRAPRRARKAPMYRKMRYNPQPTFTETWTAGQLVVPGSTGVLSGQFNMAYNSLPQASHYTNLYRQFRILRNTWICIPRFNSVDPNNVSTVPSYNLARIVYAINDTAGQNNPANEVAVLQSNGARMANAMDGKILRISHSPVPTQNIANAATLTSVYVNRKRVWLNTANANNTGSAEAVLHYGVSWFITCPQNNPSGDIVVYDVYCKTTVQFKDPA